MSMIGYYFRADDGMVQQLKEGSCGDILFDESNRERLFDVDKAWHAIHYTLTGGLWGMTGEPASWLVFGVEPVNEEDMGYGPARLIENDVVKLIADALTAWDGRLFGSIFMWRIWWNVMFTLLWMMRMRMSFFNMYGKILRH